MRWRVKELISKVGAEKTQAGQVFSSSSVEVKLEVRIRGELSESNFPMRILERLASSQNQAHFNPFGPKHAICTDCFPPEENFATQSQLPKGSHCFFLR
jgi:hypothetical protein